VSEDINTPSTTPTETSPEVASGNGNAGNDSSVSSAYLDLETAELGTPENLPLPPNEDTTETSSVRLELSELDAVEGAALLDEDLAIEFPDTAALPLEWTESIASPQEQIETEGSDAKSLATLPTSEAAFTDVDAAPAVEEPPAEPPAPPSTGRGRRPRKHPDEMEFWDHLEELRSRIFKMLAFALLGMVACCKLR
jgi:acyl carrier protein